jgi:hypothetical protein
MQGGVTAGGMIVYVVSAFETGSKETWVLEREK